MPQLDMTMVMNVMLFFVVKKESSLLDCLFMLPIEPPPASSKSKACSSRRWNGLKGWAVDRLGPRYEQDVLSQGQDESKIERSVGLKSSSEQLTPLEQNT
jgi:hypothetical protein